MATYLNICVRGLKLLLNKKFSTNAKYDLIKSLW